MEFVGSILHNVLDSCVLKLAVFQVIKFIVRGFVYFLKFITETSTNPFFVKHPSVSPIVLPVVGVFSIIFG